MRLLFTLSLICLLAAVISAKKQVEENLDIAEPETKEHVSKKYSKDYQKSHHHGGHKHKKQHHVVKEEPLAEEPAVPKQAQVEVPEPEAALQADIETSKKTLEKQKQREQTEDLHLQDLTYEENLKKDKKKKGHRGTHQAEVTGKKDKKNNEPKLFADQESKNPVAEKVIEDSFEPLMEKRGKEEKNKGKGKKNKSSNNKKAYEKSKDKGKKSKDSKKSKNGKNKDKKNKSKDKKW